MINSIIDAIFDKDFSIFGDILKKINNLLHANQNLDLIIRTKLQNNNKTMLVIIDNLDRIDNEKALFLIKSIKTITNYNNTIYILLYDETIIDAFLNKMYITDNKYMKKIVQLKIDVNEIDIDIINDLKEKICSSLIKRKYLLPSFKVEFQFKTLRELKRFFNSILSSRIDTNKNYNYSDYISLEYVKNNNIDLYYEIWNNKYYFIIDDRQFEQKLYTVNRKKLNEELKTYFNSLFSNKKH